MIVYEAKLEGTQKQYSQLDAAIRTGRFVRNCIIRAWMDKQLKSRNDAYKYCKILADNRSFPWAKKLNSMARQAHAERAWASATAFRGNKGYPKFAPFKTRASLEYKTSGWKLSQCRRYLKFTDGFKAGNFKLWGTRDLHFYLSFI